MAINLTAAVRSNLSSLQDTAALMSKTSDRLSTGNKVNSALDNPTNFFTASSLNSRAGDLNNLMDSMANGIKTIEAADNGLSAITKTLESMQSTLRQARQDKSFATKSFGIDATAIGTTAQKTLSFAGGAVGTPAVSFDLNTLAGPVPATALTGASGTFTSVAGGPLVINGSTANIRGDVASATATTMTGVAADFSSFTGGTLSINGSTDITIAADAAAQASTLTGSAPAATIVGGTNDGDIEIDLGGTFNSGNPLSVTIAAGDDADAIALKINTAFTTAGGTGVIATNNAGALELSNALGSGITVADDALNVNSTAAALGFGAGNTASTNGNVAVDTTAQSIVDQITAAGITGLTATVDNGQISLSLASGEDVTVGGTAAAEAFGTAALTSTNGEAVFDATAATIAADINTANITGVTADGTSGQIVLNSAGGSAISVTAGTLATSIGFGSSNLTVAASSGTAAAVKTVDALVLEINENNSLQGKIRASNDDGKLRIENLSTLELDVTGASNAGKLDGTSSVADIVGNSVRADLADQFNELRDQLDKLADDASFNGINLLRGDKLKITFNETGTSSIDIQTKGEDSVNSANLGVSTTLTKEQLDSDEGIDTFLDQVKGALNKVRSQSSAFGSNLSIVQNRQDFTKSMINTLETGAGNLTLADMNQEAANMMALQTRQSLASSTLSMANQADQGVLQLLR